MVYFKAMQKNHPNGRFRVRNYRSKNVSEKFRGASAPLALLLDSPMEAMRRGGSFRGGGTLVKGLSRMNLKLDLGSGFRFWLRLDLPYIPVWQMFKLDCPSLNICPDAPSQLAKCPRISLQ